MPDLLNISISKERPAMKRGEFRLVRHREDGLTEFVDYKGRRALAKFSKCEECGRTFEGVLCDPCTPIRREREAIALAKRIHADRIKRYGNAERYAYRRQALVGLATPAWRDKTKIRAIYKEARRLTRETGVKHHVDHIYPLQNELACGLHVHQNLQIMEAKANIVKSNAFPFSESPAWNGMSPTEILIEIDIFAGRYRHAPFGQISR